MTLKKLEIKDLKNLDAKKTLKKKLEEFVDTYNFTLQNQDDI